MKHNVAITEKHDRQSSLLHPVHFVRTLETFNYAYALQIPPKKNIQIILYLTNVQRPGVCNQRFQKSKYLRQKTLVGIIGNSDVAQSTRSRMGAVDCN